jgi:hypothetical protein
MAQSNQSKKLKTDLSQLVVGENWMEQTGPFLYLKMTNQESLGPFHAHELKDFIGHTTLPETQKILALGHQCTNILIFSEENQRSFLRQKYKPPLNITTLRMESPVAL